MSPNGAPKVKSIALEQGTVFIPFSLETTKLCYLSSVFISSCSESGRGMNQWWLNNKEVQGEICLWKKCNKRRGKLHILLIIGLDKFGIAHRGIQKRPDCKEMIWKRIRKEKHLVPCDVQLYLCLQGSGWLKKDRMSRPKWDVCFIYD